MTVQALARQRFGFQRLPVVTAVVFVVTATTSVLGLMVPGMLEVWQRAPQGLHGDWWRTFTALLVQDGGVAGTISNLAFLLVLGAMAEQVLGPGRWLVCYLGAGLVGELAGYVWQPRGAGNSVAICGLAGALTVALLGRVSRIGSRVELGGGVQVEGRCEPTIRAHRPGVGAAGAAAASDDAPAGWALAGSPPGPQRHLVPRPDRGAVAGPA
jgi:membrane associated rhomboid family serine protease